jgi:predicted dehydrogenase
MKYADTNERGAERLTSVMVVGCGRHAFRNHLPVLLNMKKEWDKLVVVDLLHRLPTIKAQIDGIYKESAHRFVYIGVDTAQHKLVHNGYEIPNDLQEKLQRAAADYRVDKIIIATDPEYHVAYALWALQSQKHVLLDKPISAPANLRTNPASVSQIYEDYEHIYKALEKAREHNPSLVCNILAQRRYHIGFQTVLKLIEEVSAGYGVGVTAFQSSHADGQWRPPLEIISQDYHGYNRGYGKGMHSGYHAVDIVNYLVGKTLPTKDIHTTMNTEFIYPDDYLAAIPAELQYKILGQPIDKAQLSLIREELTGRRRKSYGEISAHLSLAYVNPQGKKLSAGMISLLHDGVSQRDWASAEGLELYKNGRVRQESHYFVSGPLQAIKVIAYESDEKLQSEGTGIGETSNFDIHVFRNTGIMHGSPAYRHVSIDELYADRNLKLQDPLKDSRSFGIHDFFDCVKREKLSNLSDFTSHEGTMQLLTKMYSSALDN